METFIDYYDSEIERLTKKQANDPDHFMPREHYKLMILLAIHKNWDDKADLQNLRKALINVLDITESNLEQLIDPNPHKP